MTPERDPILHRIAAHLKHNEAARLRAAAILLDSTTDGDLFEEAEEIVAEALGARVVCQRCGSANFPLTGCPNCSDDPDELPCGCYDWPMNGCACADESAKRCGSCGHAYECCTCSDFDESALWAEAPSEEDDR